MWESESKAFPLDLILDSLAILSQISMPSPRYSWKKPLNEFKLISNFGILLVLKIPKGGFPTGDFVKKTEKISPKQWINHYKGTWYKFFHRGIKTMILFFKVVNQMIQMI